MCVRTRMYAWPPHLLLLFLRIPVLYFLNHAFPVELKYTAGIGVHTHLRVQTRAHLHAIINTYLYISGCNRDPQGNNSQAVGIIMFCHTWGTGPLSLYTSRFHWKGQAVFKANS